MSCQTEEASDFGRDCRREVFFDRRAVQVRDIDIRKALCTAVVFIGNIGHFDKLVFTDQVLAQLDYCGI